MQKSSKKLANQIEQHIKKIKWDLIPESKNGSMEQDGFSVCPPTKTSRTMN